jgi:GT2 family glycosyltransferase
LAGFLISALLKLNLDNGIARVSLTLDTCEVPQLFFSVDCHGQEALTAYPDRAAWKNEWQASFPLPAEIYDGAPHTICVSHHRSDANGVESTLLARIEHIFQHGDRHGKVIRKHNYLEGWVAFKERPVSAPCLTIYQNDDPFGKGYPLALVPTESGKPDRFIAHFRIEASQRIEQYRIFCGSVELKGSPVVTPAKLVGQLQTIDGLTIRGWVLDYNHPLSPLELLLKVDGQLIERFRPNHQRPDIAQHLGLKEEDVGLTGFYLNLPEHLTDGKPHEIRVEVAGYDYTLQKCPQTLQVTPATEPYSQKTSQAFGKVRQARPSNPIVSVVILNRNGKELLSALLESWLQHNTVPQVEFIVVDHASHDGSTQLLRDWESRLPIKIIALKHNDSFSASCNRAAKKAQGKFLLFLNNDIIWLQDALPELIRTLDDQGTAIAGLKLLKTTDNGSLTEQVQVQHLGVRFKLNRTAYWPYETTPGPYEAEYSPQPVPAVTAAVMLCRRQEFLAAGGFNESYFYGFEDVEFCLRLARQLNKRIICRNDLVALHRHGYTRLSGRANDIYQRVIDNAPILQAHIGLWLKFAYWETLAGAFPGITTETLHIGIVVDEPNENGAPGPLQKRADRLAKQLLTHYPQARLFLLPPRQGWYTIPSIHVLIVGHPAYDIRKIKRARADLLIMAWPENALNTWRTTPWWDDFQTYLAASATLQKRLAKDSGKLVLRSTAQAPLGKLLTPGNQPTRIELLISRNEPEQLQEMAWRYHKSLRQAGCLCWINNEDTKNTSNHMVHVRIKFSENCAIDPPKGDADPGTINLLFAPSIKTRQAKALINWQKILTLPDSTTLQNLIENTLGNTLRTP